MKIERKNGLTKCLNFLFPRKGRSEDFPRGWGLRSAPENGTLVGSTPKQVCAGRVRGDRNDPRRMLHYSGRWQSHGNDPRRRLAALESSTHLTLGDKDVALNIMW